MKLILILGILIFQQMSFSMSYDLEIETSFKLSPDFLRIFKEDRNKHRSSKKVSKKDKDINMRQFKTAEDQNLAMVNILEKKLNSEESDYSNVLIEAPKTISKSASKDNDFNKDIKSQISTVGTLKLENIAEKIKNMLDQSSDIRLVQANASTAYINEINLFFDDIKTPQLKYAIEREFYVLYIIESANSIFADHCNKLSYNIITQLQKKQDYNVTKVSQEIQKSITDEKKENLKYICDKFDICKTCPAYSDRIAILIKEIVGMKDKQLVKVIEMLTKIVKGKNQFFDTIIDSGTTTLITAKLEPLVEDLPGLRNFMNVVAHLITQRHKMYKSKDGELKQKTRAIRILLDMIDKAFGMLGEDFIEIEFDNLHKDFKHLKNEIASSDLKTVLDDFMTNVEEVVDFYWKEQSRDEVKILTQVIMTGTSDNGAAQEELLNKGSKFVMGDANTSKLDKILPLSN